MNNECEWTHGNEPCKNCPRTTSTLYKCKLLQDEIKTISDITDNELTEIFAKGFDGDF
jgi:hypothetical protein